MVLHCNFKMSDLISLPLLGSIGRITGNLDSLWKHKKLWKSQACIDPAEGLHTTNARAIKQLPRSSQIDSDERPLNNSTDILPTLNQDSLTGHVPYLGGEGCPNHTLVAGSFFSKPFRRIPKRSLRWLHDSVEMMLELYPLHRAAMQLCSTASKSPASAGDEGPYWWTQ